MIVKDILLTFFLTELFSIPLLISTKLKENIKIHNSLLSLKQLFNQTFFVDDIRGLRGYRLTQSH